MATHYRCQHCRWPTSERSGLTEHLIEVHGVDRQEASRAAAGAKREWDDSSLPGPEPAPTRPRSPRQELWDGAELHARFLRFLAALALVCGGLVFLATAFANRDPGADPPVELAVGGYVLVAAVNAWAVFKALAFLLELMVDRNRNA